MSFERKFLEVLLNAAKVMGDTASTPEEQAVAKGLIGELDGRIAVCKRREKWAGEAEDLVSVPARILFHPASQRSHAKELDLLLGGPVFQVGGVEFKVDIA